MTRRRWIIVYAAILSLAGCKATGNWSFKRDGDGFAYTCEPFEGYDHCGLTFDMEALKEILRHLEVLWGKMANAAEGGPPDGTTIPPPATSEAGAEPSG